MRFAGFKVLSLEEARRALFEGEPLPKRSVVITVDDGYDDFREFAWPALKEYDCPATVFLVSSLIGKAADWLTDRPELPTLMDAAAIRELHREGAHFGSHAMTHPRLSKLAAEAQREEIFGSKAALADLLGAAVPDFCYPYGDYDQRSRDLVEEAGYRTGLTCIRGSANTSHNPFELTRKAISYGDNLVGFGWTVYFKHERKG